jgi:hypothetical protein
MLIAETRDYASLLLDEQGNVAISNYSVFYPPEDSAGRWSPSRGMP